MAAIGALASVASGILGFAQAQYQGQIARNNEIIANRNAVQAINRSQIEQQDVDAASAGMIGEAVAEQGASGVTLGGGSAVMTRKALARLARQDALRTRYAGEVEAYDYRTQAADFHAQQGAAKISGVSSLLGGFIGGASSLIGNSSPVNRKKYSFGLL